MTWQIQSWPTPEMFINRHGTRVLDRAHGSFSLISVVEVMQVVEDLTGSPDRAHGGFGLTSVTLVGTPFTEDLTGSPDTADGLFSLVSVVNVLPVSEDLTGSSDTASGTFSLVSVSLTPSPLTRSVTEIPVLAGFALSSVMLIAPVVEDLTSSPDNAGGTFKLVSVSVP